jgi:TRAP-type C4-dicarboxylate transport system permease small subunit
MLRIVDKVEEFVLFLARIALALMMVIVSIDALFRNVFHSPIPGINEFVTYYLIVGVVFFGISPTLKVDKHVSIDLVTNKFPEKMQKMSAIVMNIFVLIFCLVLVYQTYLMTSKAWINNEVHFGIVTWPLYVAYAFVPLGLAVLVIRIIANIITDIKSLK